MSNRFVLTLSIAALASGAWAQGGKGAGNMPDAATATLNLTVKDADGGGALAFRAELWRGDKCLGRTWSDDGSAAISAPAGAVTLVVRHGMAYDAVEMDLDLAKGDVTRQVALKRRFDGRALGWYCGENHMHVFHGRGDKPATFRDGARQAAGDGLDYIQLGYAWEPTFAWLPAEELNRRAAEVSSPRVVVGWNVETPKCYMGPDDGGVKGNLHCFGHGWTVGLKDISRGKDFYFTGPNFRIMQEIARQGGVVAAAHPLRFWFNNGNFVSNWARELPFDFVAGVPYQAVDVLNDAPMLFLESERLWWNLLNMGYKVSGTGSSDGNIGAQTGVGRFRTYTKIAGDFTWDKLADGIRAGACVASSGPFVQFTVDGRDCGAEFPADGKGRPATIQAWSGPLPGETLMTVQIVRNGEIVRAWDLHKDNLRQWSTKLDLADDQYAWYAVRVLSASTDRAQRAWGPHVYELAVASPVYFLPKGFHRPKPAAARVALTVTDESGKPLAAEVTVLDAGGPIRKLTVPADGSAVVDAPATASLSIHADGYPDQQRCLYMDTEVFAYCRNMGTVWPSFYSPETWTDLRELLGKLTLAVKMKRQ